MDNILLNCLLGYIFIQMQQIHMIRVVVSVHQIRMNARFPCRLTVHLKSQSTSSESNNLYELTNNISSIEQTLETQTEAIYNKSSKSYEPKPMKIVVVISSANGVIPAGVCSFNTCDKRPSEKTICREVLDKCPDRQALITFDHYYEVTKNTRTHIQAEDSRVERIKSINSIELKYQFNGNSNISVSRRNRTPNANDSPVRSQNKSLKPNNQFSNRHNYSRNDQSFHSTHNELTPYNLVSTDHKDLKFQDKRSERGQHIRDISRLKTELKVMEGGEHWAQILRLKEENRVMELDIEKFKERDRSREYREKELNHRLKEEKDEKDKTRKKLNHCENHCIELERNIVQHTVKNREFTAENRMLIEKVEQLEMAQAKQMKRISLKQKSLEEQMNKLNQKLMLSQSERQQASNNYNSLLEQMEETKKRHQGVLKEKDRALFDERNKLNKKIDSYHQQIQKQTEDLLEKSELIQSQTSRIKQYDTKQQENTQTITELENQLQLANINLKNQQTRTASLQQEIKALKIIEEERNLLKKKLNDALVDINKMQEKCSTVSAESQHLSQKLAEKQEISKQWNLEQNRLSEKHSFLLRQMQEYRKDEAKRCKEAETMSVRNVTAEQKIIRIENQLQNLQRQNQEMEAKYEDQIIYLTKSKEYLENDIEEMKWAANKDKQHMEQISAKLKHTNEELLKVNETLMQSNECVKKLTEENQEIKSDFDMVRQGKFSIQAKEKELSEKIRKQNDELYESDKKRQHLEQELYITKEKVKQLENYYQQKTTNDEAMLKKKDDSIAELQLTLVHLQTQLKARTQEVASLDQNIHNKMSEINYLKETQQSIQAELSSSELQNANLTNQLLGCKQKIDLLQREVEQLTFELSQKDRQIEHQKRNCDLQREETKKVLEQISNELSETQQGNRHPTSSFSDITLTTVERGIFQKKFQLCNQYESKIRELESQTNLITNQLNKRKQQFSTIELELESELKREKQQLSSSIREHSAQSQKVADELQLSQQNNMQQARQNQKLSNQLQRQIELVAETMTSLKCVQQERDVYKLECECLENKFHQSQNEGRTGFTANDQETQVRLNKMKSALKELESKNAANQKLFEAKEDKLHKLDSTILTLTHQKTQLKQNYEELMKQMTALKDEISSLNKRNKHLEQQNKKLKEESEHTNQFFENEKNKGQNLQQKYTTSSQQAINAQIELQKQRHINEQLNEQILELETQLQETLRKQKANSEEAKELIHKLREEVNSLTSDVQFKSFIADQNELQFNNLNEEINQRKDELEKKKEEIVKLTEEMQSLNCESLFLEQTKEILIVDIDAQKRENDRLKHTISSLQQEISELKAKVSNLQLKQSQLETVKAELQSNKQYYEKTINQIRTFYQQKQGNVKTSRVSVNSDSNHRKIKDLEHLLQARNIDLATEHRKWQLHAEQDKQQLLLLIKQLQQSKEDIQNEFDFQRQQLNNEIQSLAEECVSLTKCVDQKNEAIASLKEELKSNECKSYEGDPQSELEEVLNFTTEQGTEQKPLSRSHIPHR